MADFLENLMIGKVGQRGKRCSPGAAIALAKKAGMDVPFSRVTLYSYISKGVFLHLTNKHLIEKGKRKQQYNRVAKRAPAGESIERRPERINRNEEFGHWENKRKESAWLH